MSDRWLHEHMSSILIAIEVIWVGGVIAVIAFYFIMKKKLRKKKEEKQAAEMATKTMEEMKSSRE
jgi:hypothetical protein